MAPLGAAKPVGAALQADEDFARDRKDPAKLAKDLEAPSADHAAYEAEMVKDLQGGASAGPSALLDAVVHDTPDVATSAIFQAETSGVLDPRIVSHAAADHGLAGNWQAIEKTTEDRAQSDANGAETAYKQAKSDYDNAEQRMLLELYQLSPTLTDKQMAAYEAVFWKQPDNASVKLAYKTAANALAAMMDHVGGLLGEAALHGGAVGTNARYTQFLAFQAFVDTRDVAGCATAHAWAADLGKRAKAGELDVADTIKQINLERPGALVTVVDGALTVVGAHKLADDVKAAGVKGAPQPGLKERWDDVYDTYFTPLNDLAQILGLGDLRELGTKLDEVFEMVDAKAKGHEAVDALKLERKLDEALHVAPLGKRVVTLFVEAFGSIGTIESATTGVIDKALIAFASNGGKAGLVAAVDQWRDLCGMVTEVREPSVMSKLLPGISIAANVMQLRLDQALTDEPARGLMVVGDIIAISGAVLEVIPYFEFGGEAIEAVGLAINALGDLINRAAQAIDGGPTPTQKDEHAILAAKPLSESPSFIAAHATDPDRSGKNLRALDKVLSPAELTALADADPTLFNSQDLDAGVIAANVATLRGAGVSTATIKQLCMTAMPVLTTPGGARNIALVLEHFSITQVPTVIESMPELVSAGGLTVSSDVIADNLSFLRRGDVVGHTSADVIAVIGPPAILRPGGARALFYLWVALYPQFVAGVGVVGMINTVMTKGGSLIDQAITWAIEHGSPNIDPTSAARHFYRDKEPGWDDYYLRGVWWDSGLFPMTDTKHAMGMVR